MRDRIHCLMTSSVIITEAMADVLFAAASIMVRDGISRKKFTDPDNDFEGRITTEFQMRTLAGISGTEFQAEVESELGRGTVKFLVRPADLASGNFRWRSTETIEDLIAILDRADLAEHAMYN